MLQLTKDGVVLTVWVVPGTTRTSIDGVYDGALRLRVSAPPEAGRANAAVERIIASAFRVRRATIVKGATSRRKVILIHSISSEVANARLAEILSDVGDG